MYKNIFFYLSVINFFFFEPVTTSACFTLCKNIRPFTGQVNFAKYGCSFNNCIQSSKCQKILTLLFYILVPMFCVDMYQVWEIEKRMDKLKKEIEESDERIAILDKKIANVDDIRRGGQKRTDG